MCISKELQARLHAADNAKTGQGPAVGYCSCALAAPATSAARFASATAVTGGITPHSLTRCPPLPFITHSHHHHNTQPLHTIITTLSPPLATIYSQHSASTSNTTLPSTPRDSTISCARAASCSHASAHSHSASKSAGKLQLELLHLQRQHRVEAGAERMRIHKGKQTAQFFPLDGIGTANAY